MDHTRGREPIDRTRQQKPGALPEIGEPRKDDVPRERKGDRGSGSGLAVSLLATSLIVLAGMSAYELVNHYFFPGLTFRGVHVGVIVLGTFTAVVTVYFVLRRYQALLTKNESEMSDRERAETALRESEELYRAVVENVADGISITVGTERVLVNRAFLAIHGLDEASRVVAHPFDQFILPEDREATNARVRARQGGESLDKIAEYRIMRLDGEIRAIQASVEVVSYKGRPATLAVLRDVTEVKRAETKIRDLNMELEGHVRDLEIANSDLEAFNFMASHDLRIPVVAIKGFSRRIFEKCGEMLDERCTGWLSIIRTNADRMEQLIEDLLAYSRLGRQGGHRGIISMEELVTSVIQDLNPLYPHGEVSIRPLPDAFGDERMVRQVFLNLLSNALKFVAPGRKQIVEIGGRQEGGENVYSVRDNGVGFNMEERERIFDIFQRLHGSDEFEGTGVGLAIVKRIATIHGGRVWAEGRPGEGATFYFTLPGVSKAHSDEEGGPRKSEH